MFGLRAMSGIFIGLLFVSLSYASNTLPWGQAVNVSVDAPIVFLDLQVPASNSAGFAFVSVFIASLQPSPLSLYASWTNSAPNASNFDFVAINRGFLAQGVISFSAYQDYELSISYNASQTARVLYLSLSANAKEVLVNAELPIVITPPDENTPVLINNIVTTGRKIWYMFNNTFVPQGGGVAVENYNVIAETCNAQLPAIFSYYPLFAAPSLTTGIAGGTCNSRPYWSATVSSSYPASATQGVRTLMCPTRLALLGTSQSPYVSFFSVLNAPTARVTAEATYQIRIWQTSSTQPDLPFSLDVAPSLPEPSIASLEVQPLLLTFQSIYVGGFNTQPAYSLYYQQNGLADALAPLSQWCAIQYALTNNDTDQANIHGYFDSVLQTQLGPSIQPLDALYVPKFGHNGGFASYSDIRSTAVVVVANFSGAIIVYESAPISIINVPSASPSSHVQGWWRPLAIAALAALGVAIAAVIGLLLFSRRRSEYTPLS